MTLQELVNRVNNLEIEVHQLRQGMARLQEQANFITKIGSPHTLLTIPVIDKTILCQTINNLFITLAITGNSIGTEALQQMIQEEATLNQNELSHSLINMREE